MVNTKLSKIITGIGIILVLIQNPVEVWVYSEEADTVFSFSVERDNGRGREMRIQTLNEEKLRKGWQPVKLSVSSLMYD